jgi:hypothetical protein
LQIVSFLLCSLHLRDQAQDLILPLCFRPPSAASKLFELSLASLEGVPGLIAVCLHLSEQGLTPGSFNSIVSEVALCSAELCHLPVSLFESAPNLRQFSRSCFKFCLCDCASFSLLVCPTALFCTFPLKDVHELIVYPLFLLCNHL